MKTTHTKILSLLLACVMVFSLIPSAFAAEAAPTHTFGEEVTVKDIEPTFEWYTEADEDSEVYTISSDTDLIGFALITRNAAEEEPDEAIPADNFEGKTVLLAADLDFSGIPWVYKKRASDSEEFTESIRYSITDFAGTFDGQGHTISNLCFYDRDEYIITNEDETTTRNAWGMGLFYSVTETGKVRNLTLENVYAEIKERDGFGSLVNNLYGDVENCHARNIFVIGRNELESASYMYSGGLVYGLYGGDNEHFVRDCSVSDYRIECSGRLGSTGGLISFVKDSGFTVENCSVTDYTAAVNGFSANYAGIIGSVRAGNAIRNCSVTNMGIEVEGQLTQTAGITGYLASTEEARSVISGCTVNNFIVSRS